MKWKTADRREGDTAAATPDLLLLAVICEDGADEQHEAIGWAFVVQLQSLLRGRDGGQHGQPARCGAGRTLGTAR
jgi:hypothetical protein